MTFTYAPSATPSDRTLVRYHLGDTIEDGAMFSDAEIDMVLAIEGSVGKAVISLIKAVIAKLSNEPDIQADWLRVDHGRSVDGFKRLLAEKRSEFGLGWSLTATSRHVYRKDSFQTSAPEYDYETYIEDDDL